MTGQQLFALCHYALPSILKPVPEDFIPRLKERLKRSEENSESRVSNSDSSLTHSTVSISARPTSQRLPSPLRKLSSFRQASLRMLNNTLSSNARAGQTLFFNKSRFVLRVVTEIAILTTFGVGSQALA
eukprot:gene20964-26889_t